MNSENKDEKPLAVMEVIGKRMNQIIGVLSEARFTTSDAPQSTRALTYYQEKGVMLTERKEGDGWREFNANELIWLYVIDLLRLFGYPIEKIKAIRDNYVAKGEQGVIDKRGYKARFFELPFAMSVFYKTELFFIVTLNGEVTFYDDVSYKLWQDKNSYMRQPLISIPLGDIVKDIWNGIPDEEKIEFDLPEFEHLTAKEKKIIKEVRGGKYLSVKIEFRDKQPVLLRKLEQADVRRKLTDIINEHDYGEITAQRKDGKTIRITNEITEKL